MEAADRSNRLPGERRSGTAAGPGRRSSAEDRLTRGRPTCLRLPARSRRSKTTVPRSTIVRAPARADSAEAVEGVVAGGVAGCDVLRCGSRRTRLRRWRPPSRRLSWRGLRRRRLCGPCPRGCCLRTSRWSRRPLPWPILEVFPAPILHRGSRRVGRRRVSVWSEPRRLGQARDQQKAIACDHDGARLSPDPPMAKET